jgi:uncharacterized protein
MERRMLKKREVGKYSKGIKIRAHHILCLQGFQGYGYSQDFVRNLAEINAHLESHPSCSLQVVAEVDLICQKCPHQEGGNCHKTVNSNPLMKHMDLMVLKKMGLEEGQKITAQKMYSRLIEVFKSKKDRQEICRECYWKDKCSWFS